MKKFLIKVNGNQYEVEVDEIRDGSVQAPVMAVNPAPAVTAAPVQPQVVKEAPAQAPAASEKREAPAAEVGAIKVTAPMPGTILNIVAKPGDKVKRGHVLLILEAMKMENEIVAPEDGTVATINVSKGASVNVGDLLVSLN